VKRRALLAGIAALTAERAAAEERGLRRVAVLPGASALSEHVSGLWSGALETRGARFARVSLALLLGLGALSGPVVASAQPAGTVYRVGRLAGGTEAPTLEAFRHGLRDLGWIVDQNVLIEARSAEGHQDRLPALAAELVRLRVDVIVAVGDLAIEAARRATSSIPIVMAVSTDAVERGFVTSLARPGGNITGMSAFLPELASKRIQFLREIVPAARRIGIVSAPSAFHRSELGRIESAARSLGLDVRSIEAKDGAAFVRAIAMLAGAGVDALYVQPSALIDPWRSQMGAAALKARLPAMGAIPNYAEAGFLLSYGASNVAWSRRSAYFVDRILRGARPADLPVEQPSKLELTINLQTAKALGLTISPAMLVRADRLIE
jgi:putative tryptophan/tyrosine transport system substrate-binding protein